MLDGRALTGRADVTAWITVVSGVAVALVTGLFGVLVEIIRRDNQRTRRENHEQHAAGAAKVGDVSRQLEELARTVATQADVTDLKEDVVRVREDVVEIREDVADLKGTVRSHGDQLDEIVDKVDGVEGEG